MLASPFGVFATTFTWQASLSPSETMSTMTCREPFEPNPLVMAVKCASEMGVPPPNWNVASGVHSGAIFSTWRVSMAS